jgi:hypothetical protein
VGDVHDTALRGLPGDVAGAGLRLDRSGAWTGVKVVAAWASAAGGSRAVVVMAIMPAAAAKASDVLLAGARRWRGIRLTNLASFPRRLISGLVLSSTTTQLCMGYPIW